MTHDALDPILVAVCHAYDYGRDSHTKAQELKERLFPLGASVSYQSGTEALYGIIQVSLNLLKELECTDVIIVDENLSQKQDFQNIVKAVKQ